MTVQNSKPLGWGFNDPPGGGINWNWINQVNQQNQQQQQQNQNQQYYTTPEVSEPITPETQTKSDNTNWYLAAGIVAAYLIFFKKKK